jgi:hypothetical protein
MSGSITQAPRHIATVDPGWHTALAVWSGDWLPEVKMFNAPRRSDGVTDENRMAYQWSNFRILLNARTFIDHVIIESVELWSEALVSMAAAQRGDLFTLATLVGGYAAIANEYKCSFELIPAKQWKGQLTKLATKKRVYRFWDGMDFDSQSYTGFNDHAIDAIGIGLWHAGVL